MDSTNSAHYLLDFTPHQFGTLSFGRLWFLRYCDTNTDMGNEATFRSQTEQYDMDGQTGQALAGTLGRNEDYQIFRLGRPFPQENRGLQEARDGVGFPFEDCQVLF